VGKVSSDCNRWWHSNLRCRAQKEWGKYCSNERQIETFNGSGSGISLIPISKTSTKVRHEIE
jgi:hypothetical protein